MAAIAVSSRGSGPKVSSLTGLDMSHIKLCPAIAFNQLVAGRYKLHILCVLNRGASRYGEIGRSLRHGGLGRPIAPRILSRDLRQLEERGLVSRKVLSAVPRRAEYSLTEHGRALLPILAEIVRWGASGAHEQMLGVG